MNTLSIHLKSELHDKILSLDAAYHDKNDQGKNVFSVQNCNSVSNSVCMMFVLPLSTLIALLMATRSLNSSMSSLSIPTWLIACLIPALFILPIFGYWLGTKINASFAKLRKKRISANEELINSLHAPTEIKAMNAEKKRSRTMWDALYKVTTDSNKANILSILENQLASICILFFQVLIAFVIAHFYLKENSSSGDGAGPLITCLTLIPVLFNQIGSAIASYLQTQQSEPEISAVFNLLHQEPAIKDAPDSCPFPGAPVTGIRFQDVSFSYDPNTQDLLQNFSVTLPPKKAIAIISKTGEGKSTLLHLLSRLYDPVSGSIRINDKDIRQYTISSLRTAVVRVSQQPLFIQGTIRENFKLQKPDFTDDEIKEACMKTGAWAALDVPGTESLLDFQLQLGAKNISGGQRKLLAIARALVPESKIILMDEPTSGIDTQRVNAHILPLIKELKKKKMVVFIDHNLNFVRSAADLILVLDEGKIIEFAPTEELIANKNSRFFKLWQEFDSARDKAPLPPA